MTEKEKFLQGIQSKIGRGLRFIGLSPSRDPKNWVQTATLENEVYAELNRRDEAKDQPDPEVLGRFSP